MVIPAKRCDHVLCNDKTNIAVFTFHPVAANATNIVNNLKSSLNYQAERFMPTDEQIASGCPVISKSSVTYKVYNYLTSIF